MDRISFRHVAFHSLAGLVISWILFETLPFPSQGPQPDCPSPHLIGEAKELLAEPLKRTLLSDFIRNEDAPALAITATTMPAGNPIPDVWAVLVRAGEMLRAGES